MASVDSTLSDMQRAARDALGSRWGLILSQGVVMIILGVLAIVWPSVATTAVDISIGWLFLISGIVGLVAMFSAGSISNERGFLWSLLAAALAFAVGNLLIWKPAEGALSLTFILTAFFIVEGILQIATSISYRGVMITSWGWMLASGIVDLALAAIIISGWPTTAAWAIGLLVGANLITSGWAIVMTALAARSFVQDI